MARASAPTSTRSWCRPCTPATSSSPTQPRGPQGRRHPAGPPGRRGHPLVLATLQPGPQSHRALLRDAQGPRSHRSLSPHRDALAVPRRVLGDIVEQHVACGGGGRRGSVCGTIQTGRDRVGRQDCPVVNDGQRVCRVSRYGGRTRKRARASYSPPRPQATREDGHPRRDGRRLWRLASPVGARRTNSAAYQ